MKEHMGSERGPIELLGRSEDDCTGIIIPRNSQLRRLFRLQRHGYIPLVLPDIGLRSTDEASHYPAFSFWSFEATRNKRSRKPVLSEARQHRREGKKRRLLERRDSEMQLPSETWEFDRGR